MNFKYNAYILIYYFIIKEYILIYFTIINLLYAKYIKIKVM